MVKFMNKELYDLCLELNKQLLSNQNVNEFKKVEAMLKNEPFVSLAKQIQDKQKEFVTKDDPHIKTELKQLKDEYFKHPLVNNYDYLLEEVNQLLQYVNQYINAGIR